MVNIGEKIVRLQDAKFKLQRNNSNEASIFISGYLADKLELVENTKAVFSIDKSDLIKLLCFTFTFNKTIFKKDIISLDIVWFNNYLKLIDKHFEKSSEFTFDVKKQSQDRFYLVGLEQSSGLNIRDLFIQDHVKILFKKEDSYIIKIEFSNEAYIENISNSKDNELIEDSTLRLFALKSIKHIIKVYGEEFFERIPINRTDKITPDLVNYKIYGFPTYFTQGLFYSFEIEPSINDGRSSPRYIPENLKILQEENIYLSTEWANSGESNLQFSQLVKFINDFTSNEYTAEKNAITNTFQLIKNEPEVDVNGQIACLFNEISKQAGLIFSLELIQRLVASLCTKPFVICSGLSGSGKTKLAQAFVQWISESENQYKIIPVGADWTNREPLLGYPNGLESKKYVLPDSGALQLILEASKKENQSKPYFMILDEMNLSHVERYFADFLSIMESKEKLKLYSNLGGKRYSQLGDDGIVSEEYFIPFEIEWPNNLFIIGTVNIDETTYMFSPKVLDRANVIEFRITPKEMGQFFKEKKVINMNALYLNNEKQNGGAGKGKAEDFLNLAKATTLLTLPAELKKDDNILNKFFKELQLVGSEFGYRSATEIEQLIIKLGTQEFIDENGKHLSDNLKIDIAIMQKLLPKLHGSRKKLVGPLETLAGLCISRTENSQSNEQNNLKPLYHQFISENRDSQKWDINYPISFEKIERMLKNLIENGFTSYAEA
jgi:5-methylcytosine-specific restriction protein B